MTSPEVVGEATVVQHVPDADTVFVFAHPATSYHRHFLAEPLANRGVGVLNVDGRFVGNGRDLSFGGASLDVAVAVDARVKKGAKVVLVGHSGGGPLMALVRTRLGVGDGVVLLAAHPSRAHVLEAWIDPSVTEADGRRNPALDLFAQETPLDRKWVRSYRSAQRKRIKRLAKKAASHLRWGEPDALIDFSHVCADPRFIDPTLDPNQREPGLFPFGDPEEVNRDASFFGGKSTARSFLDQWHVPTTSANGPVLAPYLEVPTLHLGFGADHLVFPSMTALWTDALDPELTTTDVVAGARHNPRDQPDVQADLADRLVAWAAALG